MRGEGRVLRGYYFKVDPGDNGRGSEGMKLWLLRKKENLVDNPKINPWYNGWDMAHGFVIRAESEQAARDLIAYSGEAEPGIAVLSAYGDEGPEVWLNHNYTECIELTQDGEEEIVMVDYHAG